MAFGPNVKQEDGDGLEEDDERYDNILEAFGGEENGEGRESVAEKEHFQATNNLKVLKTIKTPPHYLTYMILRS